MQTWTKLGRIFEACGQSHWMKTHTAVPFAQHINDNVFKIFFSSRGQDNASRIGWLAIDILNPSKVLDLSPVPIVQPNGLGCFDDDGTMGCQIIAIGNRLYLYYIGWNRSASVPFRNALGLAISVDNGRAFEKFSDGPILDRSIFDPCFVASSWVLKDANIFKMWYLSCVKWEKLPATNSFRHLYNIKYAESLDGIHWNRSGIVCIPFKYDNEYAISRPCVVKENGLFKMWYSYRGGPKGESYRIGFADSLDGIVWHRKDEEVGLEVSDFGWDSEMIEYPFVFDHKGNRYMLYNGNDYGKTGFGLAVLQT